MPVPSLNEDEAARLPVPELKRLKNELIHSIQELQTQLGDPDRRNENGRLSVDSYVNWRKRASHALVVALRSLRAVKFVLEEKEPRSTRAVDLLARLYCLINGNKDIPDEILDETEEVISGIGASA